MKEYVGVCITFRKGGYIFVPANEFNIIDVFKDKLLVVKNDLLWRFACAIDVVFSVAMITNEELNEINRLKDGENE